MRCPSSSRALPFPCTASRSARVPDPSSAIVWEVGASDSSGAGGTLYAYRAVPPSTCIAAAPCTLTPLWSAPIGTASKFTVPATDDGRVYGGTRDGHLLGFGLMAWREYR